MKKIISLFLALLLLFACSVTTAEDLGVQIIGGKDEVPEVLNWEDMVLGETYIIGGYARVKPLSFEYVDVFPQYLKGYAGDNSVAEWGHDPTDPLVRYGSYNWSNVYYYNSIQWVTSGKNADFVWFLVDLTNMQKESYKFMENCSVKVVFDDEYEYKGWIRQLNYDYDTERAEDSGRTNEDHPKADEEYGTFIRAAISTDDEQAIDMVYTGHYVFGCTLPNEVVSGKEPLRMEIQIGKSEVIYNIRK